MANKIFIRKILNVAKIEYEKWLINPRSVIFLILIIFINENLCKILIEVALEMEEKLNYLEGFIATINGNSLSLLVPIIFIIITSDFPRVDGNNIFYLIRTGKINWILGQVLYSLLAIITVIVIIFIAEILLINTKGSFSFNWSEVVTKYFKFKGEVDSLIFNLIDGRVYNHMSILIALINSVFLMILSLFTYSLISIVFYLLNKKKLGLIFNIGFVSIGYFLLNIRSQLMWIFPIANSNISAHYEEILRKPIMSLSYSYIYFIVVIITLIGIILSLVKKFNIISISEVD